MEIGPAHTILKTIPAFEAAVAEMKRLGGGAHRGVEDGAAFAGRESFGVVEEWADDFDFGLHAYQGTVTEIWIGGRLMAREPFRTR